MPAEMVQFGRYQLVKKIATGGMAEIFLAKQQGPGRFVRSLVIKRILPHLAEDPKFVAMFLDEAALAAQLSHPHIAQVYDFGEEEGHYYIALELVKGPDLRSLMRVARKTTAPPPVELSVRIMTQVLAALDYAHHAVNDRGEPLNVVHRDVSPQNILVSYDGVVKLVDFGIAKASSASSETEAGVVKGKYAYLAPEQLQGLKLDGRCDLFAASLVLYELLTLETAIKGEGAQAIANAMEARITPVTKVRPDLPMNLVAVLGKAIQRDRDKRYVDCRQFQGELEGLLVEWGVSAPPHEIADYLKSLEIDGGEVLAATADTGSFGGVKVPRPRAGSNPELASLGRGRGPSAQAQQPPAVDPEAANATVIRAKPVDLPQPGESDSDPAPAARVPTGRQRTSSAVPAMEPPRRKSGILPATPAPTGDSTMPPGSAQAKETTLPPSSAPSGDATIAPSFARNVLRPVTDDDDDEKTNAPGSAPPSAFDPPPHVEPAEPEPTVRPGAADELQNGAAGEEHEAPSEPPPETHPEGDEDGEPAPAAEPSPAEGAFADAAHGTAETTGASETTDSEAAFPKKSKLPLILGGVGVAAVLGIGAVVMLGRSSPPATTEVAPVKPAETEAKPTAAKADDAPKADTKPADAKPAEAANPANPAVPATPPANPAAATTGAAAVAANPTTPAPTNPTPDAKPAADSKPVAEAKPVADAKPAADAKPEADAKPASDAKPLAEGGDKKADHASDVVATPHERHNRVARADTDASKTATLSVASSPWAEVILDGRDIGPTPQINLTVPAGKHSLNLVNKGMGIFRQIPLQLAAGDTHKEIAKFEKGKVLFLVKPYANVTFAGKSLGQTPLPPQDAFEGSYSADFVDPKTSHKVTKRFDVKAGQQTEVRVDMTKD